MSDIKQHYTDFDEYLRQGEPSQKEKASIWQAAIGLQAVDGLQTSDYLKATACKHIEGDIDIDEARELIETYYQSKTQREPDDDEKQEADKVSANITKSLSSQTLDFSTGGYISVHRRVFDGVFKHAGKLRDYDITKREWALLGEKWDLRNRYLHIHATDEWKNQLNFADRTSILQKEYKHGTSTGQVQDKLCTDNTNINRLVVVIGNQELSVKDMMDALELKGRDNFLNLYLKPAISEGFVRLLYPNSPRHPRQKYILTAEGLAVYNRLNSKPFDDQIYKTENSPLGVGNKTPH